MPRPIFSPTAAKRLAELRPSPAEFASIRHQLGRLAGDPALGYPVPFQNPATLWRFDVGRFGFLYTREGKDVRIVTVIAG